MKMRHAFLSLALLTLTAGCGDSSGAMRDPAPSAGGTFHVEITGAETRTLTHSTANVNVSRMDRDDPPIISFRLFEPADDGRVLRQLMIQVSDVQPGEYVFDADAEEPPFVSYTVVFADADDRMTPGGDGYSWGQSGMLTIHSLSNDRLDGQFDVTIHNRRLPGPERETIRAAGEFSRVSIAN